jgi:hypothetical protein
MAPVQFDVEVLNKLMADIAAADAAYHDQLTRLAAAGATTVQLVQVAIERAAKRLTVLGGATSTDVARAVVDALTHCGRIRTPDDR